MNRSIVVAALAAGWVFGAGGPAAADTFGPWTPKTAPVAEYGSVYISFGAGAFVQQMPRVNFGNVYTVGGGTPFLTRVLVDDPDVVGGEGGGTVGVVLDTRRTPTWLGRKPRIEVSFSYGRGSASAAQSQFVPSASVLGGPFIDGGGNIAGFVTIGLPSTHRGTVDVALQEAAGAIRLKTDLRLTRTLTATPAFGFVGGQSVFDFDYNAVNSAVIGPTVTVTRTTEETLKTRRLGGEAAIDLAWRAARRLTVHGGASAAFFRMGTRLTANDCIGISNAGAPCSGTAGTATWSDFDHRTGYRLGMNAGITYDGGWFKLTVVGRGTWDSAVPGIRNPTAANAIVRSAPAAIVYDSAWRYGGGLSVTIPLN